MTRQSELHARLSGVYITIGNLKGRYVRAADIQNSIELGNAHETTRLAGERANDLIGRFHKLPTERAALESFLDEAETAAEQIEAQLDRIKPPCIRGLALNDPSVTHHCLTEAREIYSAHENKEDALYNATVIGGRCCPVNVTPAWQPPSGPQFYIPGDERNMDDREERGPRRHIPTPAERRAAEYC